MLPLDSRHRIHQLLMLLALTPISPTTMESKP